MPENRFGWINDPRAVEESVPRLRHPIMGLANAAIKDSGEGVDFFFFDVEKKLLGHHLPAHDQTIGDCVSHGWARAIQDLLYLQTVLNPRKFHFQGLVATEPHYAGSRVEIGGGRINGDGSIGAWAARWSEEYGVIDRKPHGDGDLNLTRYSGAKARRWGRRGAGVPDELEPYAKARPVRTVSLTTSYEDARDAIANGYPVPVCSMQGFTTVRDSAGFCRASGQWPHCMLFRGCCVAKGNRPALVLQQSWGESPTGNSVAPLESGRDLQLPQGCFLVDAAVCNRMLARDPDSYSVSDAAGYPARKLNFVMI